MSESSDIHEAFDLKALQRGDREAFANLVDATSAQVYRVALKMLVDAQDAEDVLQNTYLKAFRSLSTFEGRSSLTTWLYRIAVNEALMLVRRRKPQVSVEETDDSEEGESEPMELVDWCCMPEVEMLTSESRRFLDQAVQRLSPALRAVFVLRDIEGLSIRDTADALSITEMSVKTRLLRARLQLREDLTAYFGERKQGQKK